MKYLFCFFLIISAKVEGQSPYIGGHGHGFAMNKLVLKNISALENKSHQSVNLYTIDHQLYFQHIGNYNSIVIYKINGEMVYHQNNREENTKIDLSMIGGNQMILIVLKGENKIMYRKIIL